MALHQTWSKRRPLEMVVADESNLTNGFAPNVFKSRRKRRQRQVCDSALHRFNDFTNLLVSSLEPDYLGGMSSALSRHRRQAS